jgi:hypothetical protein
MPSEYDFLLPYSRRLHRVGRIAMGAAAFLAGAVCTAAIVALPLRSQGDGSWSPAVATEATDQTLSRQAEQTPAVRTVTAAKPEAQPASTGQPTTAPPQGEASTGSADRRETIGLSSPSAKPADPVALSPPPTPAPAVAAATPATPAVPDATGRPSPSDRKAKSAERRKSGNAQSRTARRQERQQRHARSERQGRPWIEPEARSFRESETPFREARRSWPRADERWSPRREFTDDSGARFSVQPRRRAEREQRAEREYDESAFAYDRRPSRRVFTIRRPSFFDDDE